jgi:Peptidase M50B-like
MKNLLTIRVLTVAVLFLFINQLYGELLAPLSIFASILHELGHSVGAILSGGEVSGFTLSPDCPCLYACTRGGSPFLILLGGNLFSIGAAFLFVYVGRIISKIPQFVISTLIFLSLLMLLTVKMIDDENILSNVQVGIYVLIFVIFMLLRSGWAGTFLIVFGFLNLILIVKDIMMGGILSDISRYERQFPYVMPIVFIVLWLTVLLYVSFVLLLQISETKVNWIEGKRFFNNLDFNKILLFISISPNMIGFAFDQLMEFLVIEFTAIIDGIRRFFSI